MDDPRERWAAITGLSPGDIEVVDSSEFVVSDAEAAELLGLSIDDVHQLIEQGKLFGERTGGEQWLISRSSVDELRAGGL